MIKDGKELKCSCGRTATYICTCGCLCCGEDPCAYGCGGSVMPLAMGLNRGIKLREDSREQTIYDQSYEDEEYCIKQQKSDENDKK